uniref:Uncharacterized protein n=1 Tax=Rhizophora mucronata TaxID=61149 RepID=A0A2P2JM84_RHIMU
MPSSHLFR